MSQAYNPGAYPPGRETTQMIQTGVAISALDAMLNGYRRLDVEITGFSVRAPKVQGGEFLLVIRGIEEDVSVVAFHSSTDLTEAFRSLEARINNGSLKWRLDEYA
jgi:hypothetical protein